MADLSHVYGCGAPWLLPIRTSVVSKSFHSPQHSKCGRAGCVTAYQQILAMGSVVSLMIVPHCP